MYISKGGETGFVCVVFHKDQIVLLDGKPGKPKFDTSGNQGSMDITGSGYAIWVKSFADGE